MVYRLVRGHRLYTTFPSALWDTTRTQTAGFNLHDNNGGHLFLDLLLWFMRITVSPTQSPKSPENIWKICDKYTKRRRKDRLHLKWWSAARVEAPEASSSQRKPEQGQYPSGIHHTGICQTKTSFWKFGKQLGVTAFPAPHYGTFRGTKGEKSTRRLDVFASLFLW